MGIIIKGFWFSCSWPCSSSKPAGPQTQHRREGIFKQRRGSTRPGLCARTRVSKPGSVETSNKEPLTLDGALLDLVTDLLGRTAVDLASDAEGGAEDLQHGALQLPRQGLLGAAHRPGNVEDLVERDRLGVFDVLLLLAVARRLLERADDERRGRGHDRHGGLSVLDGELDGDAETFLWEPGVSARAHRESRLFPELTQSPVAFAMSSPTFLGERPRGPILGARVAEDPTSPPVARRWLFFS